LDGLIELVRFINNILLKLQIKCYILCNFLKKIGMVLVFAKAATTIKEG